MKLVRAAILEGNLLNKDFLNMVKWNKAEFYGEKKKSKQNMNKPYLKG